MIAPIATGERLFTRWGFREILECNAASVPQPDRCHAGGIAALRKIASMVDVHYAGIAPHNPHDPLSTAACVHVDVATPNFLIQEMIDPGTDPWVQEFVTAPLPAVNGHIHPPTRPGPGVQLNEAACARRVPDFTPDGAGTPARQMYGAFHEDGGVEDV